MLLLAECVTMTRPARVGAVLVRGDRVAEIGGAAELRARHPGERKVVAERVTPGVHDAHAHPTLWGAALTALDLGGCSDPRAIAAMVAERVRHLAPGEWVRGGGYLLDHHPTSALLDAAAPRNPVLLASRDLHSAWANRAALRAARVSAASDAGEGGVIVRDAAGEPTGTLLERAVELVSRVAPPPSRDDLERGLEDLARRGHVAVHAMPYGGDGDLEWAEALAAADALPVRLWWAVAPARIGRVAPGWRGECLEVAAVKLFADGALGSRTAWMHEPYPDGSVGMPVEAPELLRERVRAAFAAGLTAAIHAIGTRAVAEVIEIAAELAPGAPRPLRIEHVQHVRREDLERLAGLPVALSVQPAHLESDAGLVARLLPGREAEAFPFHSLAASGAPLAFGSDAPVVAPRPEVTLDCAVTHPLHPPSSLSEEAALAAMTVGAARAAGWDEYGRITAGAKADLALWEGGRLVARVWRGELQPVTSS